MEIPYEVTARRDTGLWNAKIGIWLFLASEVMLFGGLFSGYVFLRIGVIDGVDEPWPYHVQKILPGFINTIVLIASSVFVVFAWVALKERSWKRFQMWMGGVLFCALIFLGIKAYEYNYKFSHYGIILNDGSVIEAEIEDGTDRIRFEAAEVEVDLNTGSMVFLGMVDGDLPKFKVPENFELPPAIAEKAPTWFTEGSGEDGTVDLERWVSKARSLFQDAQKEARAHPREVEYHNAEVARMKAKAEERGKPYVGEETREIDTAITTLPKARVTLAAAEPFSLHARTRKVVGERSKSVNLNDAEREVVDFVDGSRLIGTLLDDAVLVQRSHVHEVNLRRVALTEQRDAMVWDLLGDQDAKDGFFEAQDQAVEKLRAFYGEGNPIPDKQWASRKVNVHKIHLHGHDGDGHGDGAHGHEPHGEDAHDKPETGGAETDEADAHAGDLISIPRDQIKRVSNHGPQYGTYYAIYFTMTGLHGLHVIGGAIVLGYFLFFGKKLFLRNPEHMANRVEVGGLFWHFVDLVWIFLFPIMYLF